MPTSDRIQAAQRRTVRILVLAQMSAGVGTTAALTIGAVLVTEVFGREDLSGLAQSSHVLGAALWAIPAASLAISHGRRAGLGSAFATGGLGAAVAVVGTQGNSLPLLFVGMALLGAGAAASLQARYAATDLATVTARGRALSVVVWATTVGAVLGPNLVGPSGRLAQALGLEPLSGPLLVSGVTLALAAVAVGTGLRPDPLLLARSLGAPPAHGWTARRGVLRSGLATVAGNRPALLGLTAVVVAHVVMISVMVMTPVHMAHGGASIAIIGVVISVHVLGMFAFSPVMGWMSDRWGRVPVIAAGAGTLVMAVSLSGTTDQGHSARLTAGLFLLGLGWSASTVAGSALLTDAVTGTARPAAQGMSDLLMGLVAAGGGALAGVVIEVFGYGSLNAGAAALLLIPLVLIAHPDYRRTPTPATAD